MRFLARHVGEGLMKVAWRMPRPPAPRTYELGVRLSDWGWGYPGGKW